VGSFILMKFNITAILSTVLLLSISNIYASDEIDPTKDLPSFIDVKASLFDSTNENPIHVNKTLVFFNDEDRPETINKPQEITAMEWLEQLENARNNAKYNNQMDNFEFLTREISATLGGKYGFRKTHATKEEIIIILKSVMKTRTYYPNKPDIISDLYFSHDQETCVSNINENPHFAEHMGIITVVDAIRSIVVDSSVTKSDGTTAKPRQIAQSILKSLFDPEHYSSSFIKNVNKQVGKVAIATHTSENQLLIGRLFDSISETTFETLLNFSIDGEAVYRYGSDFMYDDGENKANLPYTIELFERSLEQGYTFARHVLARARNDHAVNLLNENVEKHYDEAFKMFNEAFSSCVYAHRNAALIDKKDHAEIEERKSNLKKTTKKDFKFVQENEGIILYNTALEILEEVSSSASLLDVYFQAVSVYLEAANALGCQLAKNQAEILYKLAITNYLLDDKNEGIDTYVSNLLTGKRHIDPNNVLSNIAIRLLEASVRLGYNDAEAVLDRILAFHIMSIAKENRVHEAAHYLGKSAKNLDRTIRILEKSIELGYEDIDINSVLAQANTFRSMSSLKDGDIKSAISRLEVTVQKVTTSQKKQKELQRILNNLNARTADEVTGAA